MRFTQRILIAVIAATAMAVTAGPATAHRLQPDPHGARLQWKLAGDRDRFATRQFYGMPDAERQRRGLTSNNRQPKIPLRQLLGYQ